MKSHRMTRLIQLNALADKALEINFAWYAKGGRVADDISDEDLDARGGIAVNPARLLGTAAVGTGAYLGHRAVKGAGGYGAVAGRAKGAVGAGVDKYQSLRSGASEGLGMGRGSSLKSALKAIASKFRK